MTIQIKATEQCFPVVPEFPLILKSRGPGTSSSMKLGVLFAFQGSLTTIGVSFFFQSFFVYFLKDCPMSFVLIITLLVD